MLGNHGNDVFANRQGRPGEPLFHARNFSLFHDGGIHELLVVHNCSRLDALSFQADPRRPGFRLLDLRVNHEHVMEPALVGNVASEDEKVEQVLVDRRDVELPGERVVRVEAVGAIHGEADRRWHRVSREGEEKANSVFVSGDVAVLLKDQSEEVTFEGLLACLVHGSSVLNSTGVDACDCCGIYLNLGEAMIVVENVHAVNDHDVGCAGPVPADFPSLKSQRGHERREGVDRAVPLNVEGLTSLVKGRTASTSREVEWLVRIKKVKEWGCRLLDRCGRWLLLLLLLEEADETVDGLGKCRRVGGLLSRLVRHSLLSSLGTDVPLKNLPCATQRDLFFV